MKAVKVREDLFWVGAIDWNVRNFHGYSTFRGTTYNAYLLLDDKITLFDTVKHGFEGELLQRIASVISPEKIDYLVINHIEPDHAGAFVKVVQAIKPEKIFLTRNARLGILSHFHREDFPFEEVKTGFEVKTGKKTLRFIETPMIHWPDSMMTYIVEEKTLISQDAFGAHYATSSRFDDEVDQCELIQEAAKYYANIVYPYSPQVNKLLQTVKEMKLEIEMICPDHGVVWRKNPEKIISLYEKWSAYVCEPKVLIIYDTMWKSTEKMAYAVMEGVLEEGVEVKMCKLSVTDWTELMSDVLESRGLILGSPTLNNGLLPTVSGFLTYMRGLRPRGKVGASFGSFGWSGESVKLLNQYLQEIQAEVVHEGIRVKYVPDEGVLSECVELGKVVAKRVRELCSA
ncbi:MAG: flavodoxin domain-containing protein [Caldimicrobium sp.]|nr:flavodoxin domain-containing protein [Caldimicrobium sp.]MCX7874448.1 flavodoxin domain-containing protein [Caldimicrobium sp.]MDW8094961.1 flavodoxin domain-containing protein [Caldimicrobium sp.]